ncbi:prephenate dehydrogenase [bacterium]|nr:prephenate dehydrogenase [bacterium]RQV95536.1 MAG: prephenate dehydrogenase [bacterium]
MTPFKNIAIIGVGIIGGSLGLSLKRKEPGIRILGISRKQTLDKALALGAIDQGFERSELETCLPKADLVFICTPISIIIEMLPKIAYAIRPGTLVTDVGSTKFEIVKRAKDCFKKDKYFLGGHPMAGNEGRGVEWADALLFENATYVLTPSQRIPNEIMQYFVNLIERIGAKTITLDPQLHDQVAAAVSHLPQLLAVSLMNVITQFQNKKASSLFLKLAAGGFRDMTRIASSPYEIWRDIFQTNQQNVSHYIDTFIENLKEMKKKLVQENLSETFENAARNRLSIPHDTKGFLRPHFDLSVWVEDKPGVIAAISTTLAEKGINIKDIEVLKIREGDSGTIRLSLETEADRQTAQELLKQIGFTSRPRN